MLNLTGPGKAHTCSGQTRRDFLQIGCLGALGLSLPQYLYAREQGKINKTTLTTYSNLRLKRHGELYAFNVPEEFGTIFLKLKGMEKNATLVVTDENGKPLASVGEPFRHVDLSKRSKGS